MHIQLILGHQRLIIVAFQGLVDGLLGQVNAEVEIAEVHLHLVVLDLIALILGASFALVALGLKVGQLLVAFVHVSAVIASTQVAIHKDEG